MIELDWFEEDEEDDLSQAERAFLALLRMRARTWSCGPQNTELVKPADGCRCWRAVLDLSVEMEPRGLGLVTVGVCFDGTSIRCSEVHNQSYYPRPDDQSRVEVVEATGTPQGLAEIAAEWFERILVRPVERREWWSDGALTYDYVFADTGTGLVLGGVAGPERFRRPPDRIIHARGHAAHPRD
ncbi:hypothetical protein [Kitasatospora mediocidica]|uniref:hypothetical protein n=1 Tax=Kitasatospora mediocidica TaxID=58352 RepID=UPI00056B652A|nr:hypothetical protein [Kitasatospora mediocidica]